MNFGEVVSAITAVLGAAALFLSAWDVRKTGRTVAEAAKFLAESRKADGEGFKAYKEGFKAEAEGVAALLPIMLNKINELEARVQKLEDELDRSQEGNRLLIRQLEGLGHEPVWRPAR